MTFEALTLILPILRDIGLFVVLSVCLYTEIRARIIPNHVVCIGGCLGLSISYIVNGVVVDAGLVEHFVASLIPIALFGIPYALGWFGAGDLKLLACIGALKGIHFVCAVSAGAVVVGTLLAVGVVLRSSIKVRPTINLLKLQIPYTIPVILSASLLGVYGI